MRGPMAKNIVVCCDGTANELARDRTNVVKLFGTLVKDPAIQMCYYHPGVGTMAPPGFVTRTGALIAKVAGLAFGYGLTNDICDAYMFICRHFETDDKVYLFGFSRGAYTVRALASIEAELERKPAEEIQIDRHFAGFIAARFKLASNEWFDQLASKKGLCCSFADGVSVEDVDWDSQDGRYRVRVGGQWIVVPDSAVVTEPNRFGPAVVWPYQDADGITQIRCFLPGAGA